MAATSAGMDSSGTTRGKRGGWLAFWPHVVAVYVVYHIASVLVGAVPAPAEVLNRQAWKDPTVQDEFAAWAQRFTRMGWTVTPAELEDTAWRLTKRWMRWRQTAMVPFRFYQSHTATQQFWSMFVAPHRYPCVLHIDVQDNQGKWRPVYIARSPVAIWRGAQLDNIRFRSALFRYGWPQYQSRFRQFAMWIATQAAADFPHDRQVRIRMLRFATLSPDDVRAGKQPRSRFDDGLVFALDAYR